MRARWNGVRPILAVRCATVPGDRDSDVRGLLPIAPVKHCRFCMNTAVCIERDNATSTETSDAQPLPPDLALEQGGNDGANHTICQRRSDAARSLAACSGSA